jgi:hypothetical protein
MVCCRDATVGPFFVAKIRDGLLAHFHVVPAKLHSSMRNWLFGLPGRILYEQPPCCQIKLWACSWLCSSLVTPLSLSTSFNFLCTAHTFFPERLPNHRQSIRRIFSDICTNFDAVPLSDPSRNHLKPETRLQFGGGRKSALPLSSKILYTDSQHTQLLSFAVASCYYNCRTNGKASPGNYGYPLVYFAWTPKLASWDKADKQNEAD